MKSSLFVFFVASVASILSYGNSCSGSKPEDEGTFTITVLDPEGEPIPGSRLRCKSFPDKYERLYPRDFTCDEKGEHVFNLRDIFRRSDFDLEILAPGYAPYVLEYVRKPSFEPLPDRLEVRLEKAAKIGGIVLDPDGNPIPKVKLGTGFFTSGKSNDEDRFFDTGYQHYAESDENGGWSLESIPFHVLEKETILIRAEHPKYLYNRTNFEPKELLPDAEGKFHAIITMERTVPIRGKVMDESDNPIAGVRVFGEYQNAMITSKTKTDENGEFEFPDAGGKPEGIIGIYKPGRMADVRTVTITKEKPTYIEFTMRPLGLPIKLKVTDESYRPIEGAKIQITRYSDYEWGKISPYHIFDECITNRESDKNGMWIWEEAPGDCKINVSCSHDSYKPWHGNLQLTPSNDKILNFIMRPKISFTGRVIDSETKEPLTDFMVDYGIDFPFGGKSWSRNKGKIEPDGVYQISSEVTGREKFHYIMLRAEGYKTLISEPIEAEKGPIAVDFEMEKLPKEKVIPRVSGTVLTPDNVPANGAMVGIVTSLGAEFGINNGGIWKISGWDKYVTECDENGKFKFRYIDFENEHRRITDLLPEDELFRVFIYHESGWKSITRKEYDEKNYRDNPIVLDKWLKLEGVLKDGTKPVPGVVVSLSHYYPEPRNPQEHQHSIFFSCEAKTDDEGKFVFDKLIPEKCYFHREYSYAKDEYGRGRTAFSPFGKNGVPGETDFIELGGEGRPVIGKVVVLREKMKNIIDWKCTIVHARNFDENEPIPPDAKTLVSHVSEDGSFRLINVTEGDWTLDVSTYMPGDSGQSVAKVSVPFKIPPIPEGVSDDPLDLGEIEIGK